MEEAENLEIAVDLTPSWERRRPAGRMEPAGRRRSQGNRKNRSFFFSHLW